MCVCVCVCVCVYVYINSLLVMVASRLCFEPGAIVPHFQPINIKQTSMDKQNNNNDKNNKNNIILNRKINPIYSALK